MTGAMLAALATIAWLLGGDATFNRLGAPPVAVAVVDVLAGLAIGAFAGLTAPASRTPIGAGLLGIVSAAFVGALIRVTRSGLTRWDAGDLVTIGIFALALGAPLGLACREIFGKDRGRKR